MSNIIQMDTTTFLKTNFMPYSAHVILDRALPEIDGFKPSQRRILYTMYKMGLLKGARRKSQSVAGNVMSIHPHGDASIYETMVRMSRDAESLLVPWIDSKGNFGKHYSRDMQYASARYTEARLLPIAKELFIDIDKNTVDMIDSYDGETKEPRLLPVSFPTILVNSQSGTAVGMGTNIASFNINEVIDFTINYIKNPKIQVKDYIKAPDFPTGGSIIYDEKVFNDIFDNGRGSISIRANYKIDGDTIIFEEIPYTTTYEAIVDKIVELVKDGKIKDIVDIHDRMGINGQGVEVTVKKSTNKEQLIEKLFKMTPLQSSFGCNFNLIINGSPKVLGVKGIIHEWVQYRVKTILRGLAFDIQKKEQRKHLLSALKKVLLDVDKAVAIIKETKKNSEVVKNLMVAFDIDEVQAEYVAEIKLRHLNKEYLIQRVSDIETLENEIKDLHDLSGNKMRLANLIISQLEEVKANYGQERKTQIIHAEDLPEVNVNVVEIEDYNVKYFITKEGYVKKIPLTSLRGNFTINVKEGDEIIRELELTNNSDILVFTDKQNVYKYKGYEMKDHKPSGLGDYMPSVLGLTDEEILYITVTNDYTGSLIVGFEDGKVAKIELTAYETKQNRSMLKNAYADKKALFFKHIHDDIDIIAVSSIDKIVLFSTLMINAKSSKTTIGVQIQKSKNDSVTTQYILADEFETDNIEYYRVNSAGVGKYRK